MPETPDTTLPRPFVFVLMPFDKAFDDVYELGIKAAAEKAGAYAERVDKQIFTEGILDRVFNQINKADVLVADMTGRNANVFYEVGYAHALGRMVLLLTKRVEDIPFDLQHRPHIIYGDSIAKLKEDLSGRIEWAIANNLAGKKSGDDKPLFLSISGVAIPPASAGKVPPQVNVRLASMYADTLLALHFQNVSKRTSPEVRFLYLMCQQETSLLSLGKFPTGPRNHAIILPSAAVEDGFSRIFEVPGPFEPLPPRAYGAINLVISPKPEFDPGLQEKVRFRMQTDEATRDFDFTLTLS